MYISYVNNLLFNGRMELACQIFIVLDEYSYSCLFHIQKAISENQNCNQKIKAITGKEPTLFRAPYGDYNNTLIETVKGLNMHEIQWNVDSLDWKDPTPQQIYERVVGKVQPGSIVLLHNGAKNTPAALPSILETLQKQGYEIVPISQLIYNGTYKIDNNGTQIPTDQGTSSGG